MKFEDYKNRLPYPQCIDKPMLSVKHSSEEACQYANELEKYQVLEQGYIVSLDEYRQETLRLRLKFKEDAICDVGLEGHPKAIKAGKYIIPKGSRLRLLNSIPAGMKAERGRGLMEFTTNSLN